MKYSYTGYFYPDEKEGTCMASFPKLGLEIIVEPEPFSIEKAIELTRQELEETVYFREQAGEKLPIESEPRIVDYANIIFTLDIDTDEAAKRIKVIKEFDLS